jgi:hypothetical protein
MDEEPCEWPPPGRTIIGVACAGLLLVSENVRSWEWESFARREPRSARDRRLKPLDREPKQ